MISLAFRRCRFIASLVSVLALTLVFVHLCSSGGQQAGLMRSLPDIYQKPLSLEDIKSYSDYLLSKIQHGATRPAKPAPTQPHLAMPTTDNPTGAIVAAVGMNTNLTWITEIKNPMWKLHRYNHDDPNPPPSTHFPINKGNEAMAYLSYVINNYESLPDYSIFIHGHRLSWHQEGDMVDIINNFRLPALIKAGYAPLRCDWYPSCPQEIRPIHHDAVVWGPGVHREDTEWVIAYVWKALFGPDEELPETIASQCCAQFAVTRSAIQSRSKWEYERMRQWLVETYLINDVSGRVFEKLWAYIFTKESVRCPPPQQCACEFFGQCSRKNWFIPPPGLARWPQEIDEYYIQS
ncbi:hypothetical protein BS50DRAFT_27669 [Corynespora cassiicola Philippines]|uniref:Uncharacterized protein n=1 Tax=Corynespora cassiicola Philippines TaxID=1448308 RepID=A0A2T2PB96_CORCC|nr:hypothetical protein BS50DRAFT_27669 [Corynespora cassiicola Philippines]